MLAEGEVGRESLVSLARLWARSHDTPGTGAAACPGLFYN